MLDSRVIDVLILYENIFLLLESESGTAVTMTIDRLFYRKLLRSYWGVRHMPYHIQETLFLLSLHPLPSTTGGAVVPSSPSSSVAILSAPMFGVDKQCNPVDRSCNAAIDAEATFSRGLAEIRNAMRSTIVLEEGVPRGVLEYKKLVEQGKLFWLLKRLTSIAQAPHRVPSAGAGGVRTTALLDRPGSDSFLMVDRFLGPGVRLDSVPTETFFETSRATFSIRATQYEPKFSPVDISSGDPSHDDGGILESLQPTSNRFLLTVTITPKNTAFHHVVVVNSSVFCVDVPSQVLVEEVGTFVNVTRLPLLARSEEARQQLEASSSSSSAEEPNIARGTASNTEAHGHNNNSNAGTAAAAASQWFARSSTAALAKTFQASVAVDAANVDNDLQARSTPARSESYSTTMQLVSDNGPGVLKGILYVKEMVEHGAASDDQLVHVAAQTAIDAIPFGPIALRCTL